MWLEYLNKIMMINMSGNMYAISFERRAHIKKIADTKILNHLAILIVKYVFRLSNINRVARESIRPLMNITFSMCAANTVNIKETKNPFVGFRSQLIR
jgi:hypothetical protein